MKKSLTVALAASLFSAVLFASSGTDEAVVTTQQNAEAKTKQVAETKTESRDTAKKRQDKRDFFRKS